MKKCESRAVSVEDKSKTNNLILSQPLDDHCMLM
jgi:hypothetical protein